MHGRHGEPMDRDDEGVIEAARAIRPYLNDLVGPADAALVDRRIVSEFAAGVGQVGAGTANCGQCWRNTRTPHGSWGGYSCGTSRTTGRRTISRSAGAACARPSGDPGSVEAARYICPHGDYVWYRPDVGTPVPACPTTTSTRPTRT